MERISRNNLFAEMLRLIEMRSTCNRLQVASLLIRENRIVAFGYNGPPKGLPHCGPELGCDTDSPCKSAIHAEANVIYFCAKEGIKTKGATLWVSYSPCIKCAEAIAQSGIAKVVYLDEFRDSSGRDLLKGLGIEVVKYE